MAVIIGISVEHDDRVLAAEDQQILAILVRGQPAAEETTVVGAPVKRRLPWMYCARQGAQI